MKQYCRYCANLVCGDAAWCEAKKKIISEASAKRPNDCNDFMFNPLDAFGENEKGYQPRKPKDDLNMKLDL